ncbi:hypothetical protein ACQ4LE_006065 [Meloidogyne hapla]|uniref:Uncharacterized protein n=1 Tax=Meloidogyne hapla TaxID=6305 RepID=A0A1I8BKE8_MELHA
MSEQNQTPPKPEDEGNKDAASANQEQMTTNLATDDIDFKMPKMPLVPKPKLSPEPLSPESSNVQDDNKSKSQSPAKPKEGKGVEPFIEPPEVFDNVGKDYAPLKHTSMLTEKDKAKKEGGKEQQGQQPKSVALEDFEIISDETERGRHRWRRIAIITGAVVLVSVFAGFAFYKWRGKQSKPCCH